jgi:pimeloyl-ACP methyl ester carboxylesterase
VTVFQDFFFHTADGLSLYARDYPGPTEDSEVVLCLHGLTRNSRDFHELAGLLTQDFRVIVPEQRGRGRSDYDTDTSRYTVMQYVEDMRRLLDDLRIHQVSVVGTSMGGLMTFALNALFPGLIQSAIINDIGPEIAEAGLERIKAYVGIAGPFADWHEAVNYLKTVSADIFPAWNEGQWNAFARQCYVERDDQVVIDYDPWIAEPLTAGDSNAEQEVLWSLFEEMSSLPTLLIRGSLTDLLSEECVRKMRDAHADFQVLEVPGVGHAPMLNEPGVPEAIREFLLR